MMEGSRKVVAATAARVTARKVRSLVVVCDDGAVFRSLIGGGWKELPSVPGTAAAIEADNDG